MKIYSSVITNPYLYKQNKQPSFGSMGVRLCSYIDYRGIQRGSQNTTGKRLDICLQDFAEVLKTRFRKFNRVNIMPMNVSDGTEAYLFANAIIRNEGIETFKKKYSPINASDIMSDVINNYARNGLLHLHNKEVTEFNGIGMDVLREVNMEDYKKLILSQREYPDKLYKLSDEYRKHFNFDVKDLQERIHGLNDEGNSVIAIRNCLRESFNSMEAVGIISDLANRRMRGASLLITGDYDREVGLICDALKFYFVEIKHNIWGLLK